MKKIISSLKVDINICRKAILNKSWNLKTYNFPFNRLYYIERGKGWIIHHEQKFHLSPGKLYLIPAHTLVDYQYCPNHMVQYYVHFSAEVLNGLNLFSFIKPEFEKSPRNSDLIENNFSRLIETHDSDSPADLIEADCLIKMLIHPFISSNCSVNDEKTYMSSRFQNLLAYIEDNLDKNLTLNDLSKVANLHSTYLSNLFKDNFNVPLIKYCNQRRIEKARNLLWNTDDAMDKIAEQTGFRDVFHFSKLFKTYTGMPPGKYRKMQKIEMI